jgi:hypothetical protein
VKASGHGLLKDTIMKFAFMGCGERDDGPQHRIIQG